MATKVENYSIPEDILKKLSEYSKETMIPKSRIVSMLLKNFLNEKENAKIHTRRNPK